MGFIFKLYFRPCNQETNVAESEKVETKLDTGQNAEATNPEHTPHTQQEKSDQTVQQQQQPQQQQQQKQQQQQQYKQDSTQPQQPQKVGNQQQGSQQHQKPVAPGRRLKDEHNIPIPLVLTLT